MAWDEIISVSFVENFVDHREEAKKLFSQVRVLENKLFLVQSSRKAFKAL